MDTVSDNMAVLLCPHGVQLYVVMRGGVYHYQHPDGASCSINNSFVVTVPQVLTEIGKHAHLLDFTLEETPTMCAAFVGSLPVRLAYYRGMSQASAGLLETMLKRLLALINGAHNETVIAWELDKVFKQVVFVNIARYSQVQYVLKITAPEKPYRLPQLPMVNIENARRDNAILEIERDINQANAMYGRYRKTK